MREIQIALRYLAARCNYASSQDGAGFSKFDAGFGHDLAARASLSYGQACAALKMLRKYTRQLTAGGITLPDAIPAPSAEPFRINGRGGIGLRGDSLEIRFPSVPAEADRSFLKTIKGWRYDGDTRAWLVPLSAAEQVADRFPSLPLAPEIAAKQAEKKAQAEADRERAEALTATLLSTVGDLSAPFVNGQALFPFQQEAVQRLLESRRVILADDMGLGKTRESLCAAKAWQVAFDLPVLVIAPASLRDNWLREAAIVGVRIEIFSWAKLPEAPETDFLLIADEAHYAQAGSKSKRGVDFLALSASPSCQACYCISGTPIKNGRPSNLFPLLVAVRHPLSRDKSAYERRYCDAHATRWSQWDVTGATHLEELHGKIAPQMVRRLKKDVLHDLPEKTRILRKVEMSAEARSTYTAVLSRLRADYKARIARGEIMSEGEALVILNHLRHAGSLAKVETAIEMAEETLEQGSPIVVFTEFVESAKAIASALSYHGVELLTGETPATDRQAMIDRFQSGHSRVFVSTIKAGGLGITLTAASTVLLVDRAWTPGDCDQAEDRCHRISQKNAVSVYWLQANGCDEKIDAIIASKRERIALVLAGEAGAEEKEGLDYTALAREIFK